MIPHTIRRRQLLSLLGVGAAIGGGAVLGACRREERCRNCGMRIDPRSAFMAELVDASGGVTRFDTPRCALQAWRGGKVSASSLRVQEYYERAWRDASTVRFVVGGDVLGPMGPDLVPVDPARATKFIQDHGASRALRLDEIDQALLLKLE